MSDENTIKVTCAYCQDESDYEPSAFLLTSLETTHYQLERFFEFFCKACHRESRVVIDWETFQIMCVVGMRVVTIVHPDEVAEQWARRDLAALTEQDAVAFERSLVGLVSPPLAADLREADTRQEQQ